MIETITKNKIRPINYDDFHEVIKARKPLLTKEALKKFEGSFKTWLRLLFSIVSIFIEKEWISNPCDFSIRNNKKRVKIAVNISIPINSQ